jgi:HEPN domain-containing protein
MDMKEIRQITGNTFANQQSNEESWYSSAISFHEGAYILEQHKGSTRRGMLVYLTNAAVSIELLLKAIIVAKDGKARITHELLRLAHDAGVAVSSNQEATLEWLTEILKWSGRYPVPNKEEDWDHYFDVVQERHTIREREGNVGVTRANRETFPSVENYEKLWDLANGKWCEIQIHKRQTHTHIGTTADPSLRSG